MPSPSVTYTFTNGTVADANQVNTNFTDIINGVTDGTKDLSISALTCAGAATLNGNVTLGNASSDDITITGSLASSIAIKTDATYNIGSTTLGLAGIYLTANSNSVRLTAASAASADWTFAFPAASGTAGHVLQTTGSGAHTYVPLQTNVNAVSGSDYTVTDTDGYGYIAMTTGASSYSVHLPTLADNQGRVITVVKVDSGAGRVTINAESTETINGLTVDEVLSKQHEYWRGIASAAGWITLGQTNRWDYRQLSSDVTSDSSDITDLKFSNLKVGKTYRLTYNVYGNVITTDTVFTTEATNNGVVIVHVRVNGDSTANQSVTLNASNIFVAAATTLVFSVAGLSTASLRGNSNFVETYAVLEELNNYFDQTNSLTS